MLLATIAVCALSLPALADEMGMKANEMMMMGPDGKMSTMEMSDPKMAKEMGEMMEKHGKPVSHNMMMMMYDGKMYMMQDMKMSNGKMMSDEMMMK
jgi:hypothetical protein